MNLKAWAVVTGAGVLVKGSNVTSVARTAAGAYTVTFTAPMTSGNYVYKFTKGVTSFSIGTVDTNMTTANTGSALVAVTLGGTSSDVGGLWEFYE
jgi:hypothetical protein